MFSTFHLLNKIHSLEPSERLTELHREEKREEGDRDNKKKRGNQKGRE